VPTRPANAASRIIGAATRYVDIALEAVCIVLLTIAVSATLTQVFFRYVLNASLSWPEELARWAFVWLVFLGMAIGVHRGSHIAIDLLARFLPKGWLPYRALTINAVLAATSVVLVVHGADMVGRSTYVSPALGLPFTYLYLAVPLGGALSLFFLAQQPIPGFPVRFSGLLACILGVALYFVFWYLAAALFGAKATTLSLMVISLGLILFGVPVAFSLIFGSFAAFAPKGALMLLTISQNMTAALDSFSLLAIPFFILAAAMMNVGGITERLIELATRLVGHLRGGLGHVNVLTNTMMAGVSGSSMADAAAIAKSLVPEMERRGYSRPFSCALTSSAGILANLIPPSLGLIIYGALASVSVGALFVASIVPGIIVALALALVVHIVAVRQGFGADTKRASLGQRLAAARIALPALVLPVLIVGGVRFGVFTATEAGAMAALYALGCGIFIYRQVNVKNFIFALRDALSDTIAVMIVIAAASPFAWVLVTEQVPQTIAGALGEIATNPLMLLLLLNVFLLLTGLFMEMIAAMVILVPIFIPIILAANIDPVHFGVIVVINLVIGALTPPLGMLVFTTARVTNTSVTDVFRAMIPFLVALIIVLMLVTFFPVLSLGLTGLIGP